MSLNTSQSLSFSINSSYNNINKISKFKYIKNSELKEKTEEFILNQINIENKREALNKTCIKTSKNLFNMNFTRKITPTKSLRKKSVNTESTLNHPLNQFIFKQVTPISEILEKNFRHE